MNQDMQQWVAAMRRGDFESAWEIGTRSLQARDPATRDDKNLPYHQRWLWDGSPLDGKHVLVRCYHGLGDTIQFARYLPLLAERAASLAVEVQPRLIQLLSTISRCGTLLPFDPARPRRAEYAVEITELDLALRIDPTRLPPPYLRASRALLPAGTVALCHVAGDWDPERSVPSALMAPLCHLAPCITLVSGPSKMPVLNPGGCPFDIGVTASLVMGAALVITVDTMIAHLAGALGKPVWLLLKAEPDWRWNPKSTGSPWYPSLRIYTQPRPGDWTAVIDRVAQDLVALSNRRTGERTP